MFKMCGQLCKIDIRETHDSHDCGGKCPFLCVFGDEKECSSLKHFHDFELTQENHEFLKMGKRHICGTDHPCKSKCMSPGICDIKRILVSKVFKNKYNDFIYPYVDLKPRRRKCQEIIKSGEISHEKPHHICGSAKHFCESRCPDCNCLCDQPVRHSGFHSSNTHRNKEYSNYISIEEAFSKVIQENGKKQTVIFLAGEAASPEMCDQYCITKGRGHSHPLICKGGDLCLEKTNKGNAIHSNVLYKSGTNEDCYYDLVTCDTYWMKCFWMPPNSKNPDIQKIFGKCNFTCEHQLHENSTEKVYCEGKQFHSMSINYSDHDFRCTHQSPNLYNIVFIIDCTGSMSKYFNGVKNIIQRLVERWGNDSNKFAFVGYTDHEPNNGHFPKENPVCVFPVSGNLIDGDADSVGNFISQVKSCGGGSNGGEAMIDGLAASTKLIFQQDASKIFIVISDDSPHGLEFNFDTEYRSGCPCGHDWKNLLQEIKIKNADFILVKLDDVLNKTADLFQSFYGPKLSVTTLKEGIEQFESKVLNIVSKKIETDFAFSRKLRK